MDGMEHGPAYRDRRTGLILFGIVEIIIGLFCLLLAFFMVVGVMMGRAAGTGTEIRMIVPSLLMYPVLAAAFISLGIGSMMRRRWARALSLIAAWSWLLVGIAACVMLLVMAPMIFGGELRGNGAMPEEAKMAVMVIAGTMFGFMFIVVPGSLVLFYRSPHVKATCEAADPHRRWTDACPLPVLAVSLWMLFGGLMMPLMPISYNGVFPFFGKLLHGVAGTAVFLVLTIVWLYAAWAIYRLKRAGWLITVVTVGLLTISNAVTFGTIDLTEMYRAMGYSEAMLQQIKAVSFSGRQILAMTLIGAALLLGYLAFIYRYFRNPMEIPAQPAGAQV
jgi:hypothetical protein